MEDKYIRERHFPLSDMRMNRARQIAFLVMGLLQPFFDEAAPYIETRKMRNDIFDKLLKELHDMGAYILTDEARAQCGLPGRNVEGWTAEELIALERKALEIMNRPIQAIVPPLHTEKEPLDDVKSWETNTNIKAP